MIESHVAYIHALKDVVLRAVRDKLVHENAKRVPAQELGLDPRFGNVFYTPDYIAVPAWHRAAFERLGMINNQVIELGGFMFMFTFTGGQHA